MSRSESLEAFVDVQWDSFGNAGLAWKPREVERFEFVWMRPLQAEFWTYSFRLSRKSRRMIIKIMMTMTQRIYGNTSNLLHQHYLLCHNQLSKFVAFKIIIANLHLRCLHRPGYLASVSFNVNLFI